MLRFSFHRFAVWAAVGGVVVAGAVMLAAGGGREPASQSTTLTTGSSGHWSANSVPTAPAPSTAEEHDYLLESSGRQVRELADASGLERKGEETYPELGFGTVLGDSGSEEPDSVTPIPGGVEVSADAGLGTVSGELDPGSDGAVSSPDDGEAVDSGTGSDPGAGKSPDVNTDDGVVELIESAGDSIGNARSVPLEETTESDEGSPEPTVPTGGSLGKTHVWYDGDRMLEARLEVDLVVTHSNRVPEEAVVADTGSGRIVKRSGLGLRGELVGEPVFRSASGELMLLPGGAIVVLDNDWARARVDLFFESNGISVDHVSELDWLDNGFFVETPPGFASLDTANALVGQPGVKLSTPNWWVAVVTK